MFEREAPGADPSDSTIFDLPEPEARAALTKLFEGPEDALPSGLVADLHHIAELGTEAGMVLLQERAARLPALEAELAQTREQLHLLQQRSAEQDARLQAQRAALEEQQRLLHEARAALTEQFRNLAQDILEDKARRFDEHSHGRLQALLEPLRERLTQFEQQVRQAYHDENKERVALRTQVQQLMDLNHQLSTQAHQLTQALR
ncbi:MAG: DNA recombination protein RmuC, partial [Burkholderiaceae bacterium]|nr:DNA recombination protein RmuC [Burkholderiaceae bacterium]